MIPWNINSMSCASCLSLTGAIIFHDDTCPVLPSLYCRRCSAYGHLAADCCQPWGYERPTSLEELIPHDIRQRWGVQTSTPFMNPFTRDQVRDAELSGESIAWELRVLNVPRDDGEMRKFMADNSIRRTHANASQKGKISQAENIARIREWAIERGFRVQFVDIC